MIKAEVCRDRCQYAIDVSMGGHSCAEHCQYLTAKGPYEDMEKLLRQARDTGQMIGSNNLVGVFRWWPGELVREWERGQFLWSAENFYLVDPESERNSLVEALEKAEGELKRFDKRAAENGDTA